MRGYQRRPAESLHLYLKALAQYHSTVGPKHFRVADVYHKIGVTYEELGLLQEARFVSQANPNQAHYRPKILH